MTNHESLGHAEIETFARTHLQRLGMGQGEIETLARAHLQRLGIPLTEWCGGK